MEIYNKNRLLFYAFFTALATTIYALESIVTRIVPIPFLRLGLANAIILYLIFNKEYLVAFWVNILKTILGGFFSYTLLSPATILSLGGSIGAYLIMTTFHMSKSGFSIIGISISGAVIHNIIQIILVHLLLISKDSIFSLIPFMIIIGIITGFITGIVAYELFIRLQRNQLC